jgi:hypothetical protein
MNKSFRSRMGSVMRRSSTILAISRPSTPARTDSDAGSIASSKQPDTLAPVAPDPAVPSVPSPIAESPAREAQDLTTEPVGPSRLAEAVVAESPRNIAPNLPSDAPATELNPMPEIVETAPTPTTPIPAAGPGAFTDEFALPQGKESQSSGDSVQDDAAVQGSQPVSIDDSSASVDIPVPEIIPQSSSPAAFQGVIEDIAYETATPQPVTSQLPNASRQLSPRISAQSSISAGGNAQEISFPMYPQASPQASKVSLTPSAQGAKTQESIRNGNDANFGQGKGSSIP